MRILFINHEYPPFGGGAATITQELFSRFENSKHEVHLLTGNIQTNKQNITSIKTRRKSNSEGSVWGFIKFILLGFFKLRSIHKSFQPDIVFAFFTIPGGMLARIYKFLFKTPYIVSIRGGDIPGFQLGKKHEKFQKFAKPFVLKICKKATLIHVNSQRLYNLTIQNAIDLDKVTILPNGINLQDFSYRENIVGEKLKILFTGRLSKQKNLDVFLKALSLAKIDFQFTIIGNGPEKENLVKIVQDNSLNVEFLDWMERVKLQQLYREYNIFILPSMDEGMSNSALEAVVNQCALLSSKNAHLQWKDEEIMSEWVVDDYLNPGEWLYCLDNLSDNFNKINDISIKMKQFIHEKNDWNKLFPKYEEMILKCVE